MESNLMFAIIQLRNHGLNDSLKLLIFRYKITL
jgi:hypothetical protein